MTTTTANNDLIWVYATYAVVSIGLITWLARTLYRNGTVFLADVWPDNEQLAGAVNHLLVLGFFMLNLGYAAFLMKAPPAADTVAAIETLARRLGILLVTLGAIHFVNMWVLFRVRRRATLAQLPPPPAPTVRYDAQPAATY